MIHPSAFNAGCAVCTLSTLGPCFVKCAICVVRFVASVDVQWFMTRLPFYPQRSRVPTPAILRTCRPPTCLSLPPGISARTEVRYCVARCHETACYNRRLLRIASSKRAFELAHCFWAAYPSEYQRPRYSYSHDSTLRRCRRLVTPSTSLLVLKQTLSKQSTLLLNFFCLQSTVGLKHDLMAFSQR